MSKIMYKIFNIKKVVSTCYQLIMLSYKQFAKKK